MQITTSANSRGKGISSMRPTLEILRRQTGSERCGELANVVNSRGVRVDCKHLAALAKQVNEIPAVSAPGVEHAHTLVDISAEDLIEDVNIDLAELVLNGQCRVLRLRAWCGYGRFAPPLRGCEWCWGPVFPGFRFAPPWAIFVASLRDALLCVL